MPSEEDLRRAQYFIRHIELYEGREIEELAKQFELVRESEMKRVWEEAVKSGDMWKAMEQYERTRTHHDMLCDYRAGWQDKTTAIRKAGE